MALAGFSAIVVLFKRRESGKWLATDADRFQGMVVHAMYAAAFCLLPWVVRLFSTQPPIVWSIASGLLGAQLVCHVTIILRLPTSSVRARLIASAGFVVAALQFANALGVGFAHELRPYVVGILWHMFHAGMLFVMLVLIAPEHIQHDGDIADDSP